VVAVPPAVENGMRAIMAADRRFDSQAFLEGVQNAYRMILEAFWRGDNEELAKVCDKDVADAFAEAIAARAVAGDVLENRLVRIEETTITAASYSAPVARISVCLAADIAAITRDAAGTVIAGSLNEAVQVRDVWTFRRDITSPDPDWQLDETDEG
jgi:predicted lipid-binding transport protein (Tim44 family)